MNRIAIFAQLVNLERLVANGNSISLTIFDDRPEVELAVTDMFPVYHARWNIDRENEIIASHDIALLPPYPGAWGKVKSNNKHLTAWACGLPVVNGECYESIERLMDWQARSAAAQVDLSEWTAEKSAREWEQLIG